MEFHLCDTCQHSDRPYCTYQHVVLHAFLNYQEHRCRLKDQMDQAIHLVHLQQIGKDSIHPTPVSDPCSPTAANSAHSSGRGNRPIRSFHGTPCWKSGGGWRRPAGRIWTGCFQRDLWKHDIGGVAVFVMARSADASVRMTEPPGSNGISCTPPWASNMAFPALDANLNLRLLPWMRLPMRLLQFADGHSQIALRDGATPPISGLCLFNN